MQNPTAAIIIIGNEILSGRIVDQNTEYLALKLQDHGINLIEVRIIGDNEKRIVETVNSLRGHFTYLFITGGIGPTHDDITIRSVAKAFNLSLELNQDAYERLTKRFEFLGREMNVSSEKMAYLPLGCKLINNPISAAPGFIIENVYVMAGVPNIMQAMFNNILPTLKQGEKIYTKTIEVMLGESIIAKHLEDLQNKFNEIEIGSYPFVIDTNYGTNIVFKSTDFEKLIQAALEFENYLNGLRSS